MHETIQTVMVATDFSETAGHAVQWAASIAQSHGARLEIFHALQAPPVGAIPEVVPLPPAFYEHDRREAERLLQEAAAGLSGIEVGTSLRSGTAAATIVDVAGECQADLLVVGIRGTSALERVFLGSVAARVVRESPCPVLSVPGGSPEDHRAIRKVLLPTDFSRDATRALEAVSTVLGPASDGKRIRLLHVWSVPVAVGVAWPGSGGVPDLTLFVDSARKKLEEEAAALRAAGYDVEAVEREGEPAQVIDEEAREMGADVIAIGTHGRSGLRRLFLGSVAERVLPAAPCPVLTVRREDEVLDE